MKQTEEKGRLKQVLKEARESNLQMYSQKQIDSIKLEAAK